MEQRNHEMGLLDLMGRPAFCVSGGRITRVNAGAAAYNMTPEQEISQLLRTGAEEYAEFKSGCLYLTLDVNGAYLGASVTRLGDFDVFCLEALSDSRELQAMALAARELRNPLSAVMVTAQRLFPVSGLEDDPDTRKQVARLNRGLFQILRVIGNMSDAGQSTAAPVPMETLNITQVLDEIFVKAAALVEHAQVNLTFRNHPEAIYCLTDRAGLERAVLNMLSNAMKFSSPGSTIQAVLTRRGQRLYLSMTDHGLGIPENLRGEVFTRYQRPCCIEDGRFGIGLGMVLIRAAAAAHGGAVLVDHPEGSGTRITMSLAIRQGDPQMRSNVLQVDYTGERDYGLIELSDILPDRLYEKEI